MSVARPLRPLRYSQSRAMERDVGTTLYSGHRHSIGPRLAKHTAPRNEADWLKSHGNGSLLREPPIVSISRSYYCVGCIEWPLCHRDQALKA